MEISLHHLPKLLKIPEGEYNAMHPLYAIPKIMSNMEAAENMAALEAETGCDIEIDQSTGTQGYATVLIRCENDKFGGAERDKAVGVVFSAGAGAVLVFTRYPK